MKKISRKTFLKDCMLTLGSIPFTSSFIKGVDILSFAYHGELSERRRGSWVRKGAMEKGDIILAASGRGCNIVVAENENSAIKQAARFLSKDIYSIAGFPPPIVNVATSEEITIRLVTLAHPDVPDFIDVSSLSGKWEAYKIVTTENTIWLIGSDFRGTAFAAYTLSERLGIDPLYLWTNYQPEQQSKLVLKKTDHQTSSPIFKYRGFFHDDEDILPRPFEDDGTPYRFGNVPLQWYERFFETALRLRMNMVAPYTRVRRRYEVQKCASDWGLFYTSHHYDILLSNPFGIERFRLGEKRGVDTQWDWFKNKENMLKYWRAGVEENKHLQAIYPVGLRGTDDHAYEFPKDTPASVQASVFREALEAQVKSVKEILPATQKPIYHFTLYTEMLEKYKSDPAAFNVPAEVIIVWPDDNDGSMRNLPKEQGQWKHGVYYHLAYFGGDNTKQNVHTVSPQKIAAQFGNIIQSGATEFMLANVSEMREFVMEARMLSEICWDTTSEFKKQDAAENYIKWWAAEYFAPKLSNSLFQVYQRYHELLSTPLAASFGATQVEILLDKIFKNISGIKSEVLDTKQLAEIENRIEKYDALLKEIASLKTGMTHEQMQFLYEHIECGLLFDLRPLQAAVYLSKALVQKNETDLWIAVSDAYKIVEQLEVEISRAERPPFEHWYRETWIRSKASRYNIHRPYEQVREFLTHKGTRSPVQPKEKSGHRIKEHQLWSDFLDAKDKLIND